MGKGGAAFQDLNQTVAERRALRGEYRKLHTETIAGKENLVNGEELQNKLQQLEALHRQVARPREHAVDAEVLAQLTECSLNMIKRGQAANQGRTPGDLIRALRVAFITDPLMAGGTPGYEAFDWAELGAEASILHRAAPGVSCMLGPLAAEAKVRKAVVRQPKRAVAELTKPQELMSIHEEEKQETDRNMENMWRHLGQLAGQQVPLTHLVCNHNSFAQTVENVFTLSFLVRDQRVRLEVNPESGLMVQTVSEAEKHEAAQQGRSKAQQFMMNITMEDWRLMKLLVPAASCVMPHRPGHGVTSQQHPAAAAAAGAGSSRPAKRARRSS